MRGVFPRSLVGRFVVVGVVVVVFLLAAVFTVGYFTPYVGPGGTVVTGWVGGLLMAGLFAAVLLGLVVLVVPLFLLIIWAMKGEP